MLQFILGRASSGKTYTIIQKIKDCLELEDKPVLLVPEQFSFESEKNILDAVGDGAAQRVSVISFTRLCDEIERINGGVCGESITDADRIILMTRAVKLCRNELVRFKKYATSSSFARLMIDTIGEFKMNFITSDDLRRVADDIDDEQLKFKLLDTALIYENYDAIVSEKFIDSTDRLTKLYYALEKYRYFDGKNVFIDSFKGFSGQQYKILERIISQAKNVTITLADNPIDTREFGIFSNIKRVKNRISAIARKFAVKIDEDIILNRKNYNSEELSALEDFMATGNTDYAENCKNITICEADSIYTETEFVTRNIRRIVRETGARYNDFVIIARDTAPYEDALDIACKKNNISCFIDKRIPLINLPTATAVLMAANVAKNFSTENILRFHKSGIEVLTVEEIATIENYTYLWNIDGEQWKSEWTMDPDGFSANKALSERKLKKLATINELRKKAIEPLARFEKNFKGTAKNMARALVNLLDNVEAAKQFKKLYKKYDDSNYGDAIKQSWDSVMKILNSLSNCFGESEISDVEFSEALRTALSLETVGIVPQMIDEAVFGSADRIRPSRPKYAFILGANQGVFPRLQQSDGLFANNEREKLIALGIDIPDKMYSLAIDEECLLYSNVCCATDGVFISYTTRIGTAAAEPSSFVNDIKKRFNCRFLQEPSPLNEYNLPESYEDAFSRLCGSLSLNDADIDTLVSCLEGSGFSDRINSVLQSGQEIKHSISADTAKKLFGEIISMSPTNFDTFSRCRFMHFCRYGLGIENIEPVEFNKRERGKAVHYVLERVIEDHGKAITMFDDDEISRIVDLYMQEYLDMIAGYNDVETPYLKYIVSTIKRTLKYVVEHLINEFKQSDFTPVKSELQIGDNGDLPAIEIPIEEQGALKLSGKVDRVDKWKDYVRIVDYKTGGRNFRFPDILFGHNMQMLLYLYAVSQSEDFGGKSAGILYMPASRDKSRMNGLIAADENLVKAMEKENSGEFVPKYDSEKLSDSFINQEDFDKIFKFIENRLKCAGHTIYSGDIAADPVDGLDSGACAYCEFNKICRIGDKTPIKVPKRTNAEVMQEIERQVTEDGI